MFAKSAPQLVLAHYARNVSVPLRTVLISIALTLLVGSAAWLIQRSVSLSLASAAEDARTASAAGTAAHLASLPALAAAAGERETRPHDNSHRVLAEFLAKRYRVSQAVTLDLLTLAHAAGQRLGLDPLLIIAVMAVESRFNPIAESVMGAKGLMQVIPRYHADKFAEFGGIKMVFDPETNILVGSQILKEYLKRTGSLNTALRLYGGASSEENNIYSGKVITEKQRLRQVLLDSAASAADAEKAIAGERVALAPAR